MVTDILRVGRPFFSDSDIQEITSMIASVLDSAWLTCGAVVAEFERSFCMINGIRYSVALSSCTAALHCLISLLGIGPNDEVIVPANTFASTANAVMYVGAKPVFADCDLHTFNITADTIESRITPKTRAVIVVHIAGNPCEMDNIVKLCRRKNLFLIEDCAHALGSKYKGKSCGSFGVASAFSFHQTKVITSGEGGIIATESEEIYENAKVFRNLGKATIGAAPIMMLGYNYRMTDIQACIGINQLRHLQEFIDKRNELARLYAKQLSSIDWVESQHISNESTSCYYAYLFRLLPNAPVARDHLTTFLKERGIETRVMFKPVYRQPYYKVRFSNDSCPNAELIGDSTVALPLHVGMKAEDVYRVIKVLKEAASVG